jgi:molecular chaperone DnaK
VRLGIDFGTTHTVVAMVDRGNYPVVSFEGVEFVPSLVAARHEDGALRFGAEASAVRHAAGWSLLRSFKRLLNDAGPETAVEIGPRRVLLVDVLAGFFDQVHRELVQSSNAGLTVDEELEVAVSVPANSSTAQRFLTLEAFRRAGFDVLSLLNEPSAAGFEYAHRYRSTLTAQREHVVVYDLGGGTFDASLLKMARRTNEVVTSRGVVRLGGDDFDEAIFTLVAARAGLGELAPAERELVLEECARQKESVSPNTKRFVVDLSAVGREPIAFPVDDVYQACAPLVERTMDALEPLLSAPEASASWDEVAGLYIVGGGGAFPLVPRRLKERFGERRIRRSAYPFAATAIGLAITLDAEAGWELEERLTRTFGVFREAQSGGEVTFDPIFSRDTPLPKPGEPPLMAMRRYRPAHNIGHFRFLECSHVVGGRPDGDVVPWEEVHFPFDRSLRDRDGLSALPVVRQDGGPDVEEVYRCGPEGGIAVTVTSCDDGFSRTFSVRR